MAQFDDIVGTISVDKNILKTDNQNVGGMFSANLVYSVNFNDDFWESFEVLEWYAANSYVEKTEVCIYDSKNKTLTIPYGRFTKDGNLYVSLRGIKGNVKYASNVLALIVSQNINIEDNTIVEDPSWLDKVSLIIDEVFVQKYDPQYEALVKEVTDVKDKVDVQQEQINSSIAQMGEYEWDGTRIRFKIREGVWGEWKDIAGEFAKQSDMSNVLNSYKRITELTKQMYQLLHPVGTTIKTTTDSNPGDTFGGTWELKEKNHPTYEIIDTIVKTGTNTDFIDLISWSQILIAFDDKFGITPTPVGDEDIFNKVFVDVLNGHVEAAYVKMYNIQWAERAQQEKVAVVTFDKNVGFEQRVRINYKITYVDEHVTYYVWERVT